jgi:hypothetical protein
MADATTFDPGRYLTKVGSSDYLEVKWRLVWLREVHPEAIVETELVSHSDQMAIFRARVTIPDGGSATGYGSEGYDDFRDYIEKAETKAIGRALAALGFGTQFCPDFDFGAAHGAVVDSPIDFASTRGRRMATGRAEDRNGGGGGQPATPRQLKFIQAIAREHGIADEELSAEVEQLYGRQVSQLDRRDASAFIERLQSRRSISDLAS